MHIPHPQIPRPAEIRSQERHIASDDKHREEDVYGGGRARDFGAVQLDEAGE